MTVREVRWLAGVVVLMALSDLGGAIGQQAPGTASVSGVVLTTESTPRPVRRAIVSLRGSDLVLGHHAITDDQGRFTIRDLPAGAYGLSAKRAAFVTIEYGASRPGLAGTPVALAAGQQLSGVTVRMAPGGVITGTVRNDTGAPEPDLMVNVERYAADGTLVQVWIEQTDPQGAYRLYGLAAGTYSVSARPQTSGAVVYARSDAEVDAILQRLQRSGISGTPQTPVTGSPITSQPVSNFTEIFYPSAFTNDDATPIVLGAGEERSGVDLTIRRMPMARLAGHVVTADGQVVSTGSVDMVRASRHAVARSGVSIHADGTFEFTGVAPGRYQLVTWRGPTSAAAARPCEFAAAEVEIAGSELPGVQLALKPCLKIAARVELANDATPGATRASLTGASVHLDADRSSGAPMYNLIPIRPTVGADGRFIVGAGPLDQLVPGSYLIRSDAPGSAPGKGLWLESVRTADGRDVLDAPLTLTDSSPETTNVVLTFTDRHTSLSGSLVTAAGRPAIDYTIIAFTTNRDWWRPRFRRVLTVRPATDGAFVLHDLPPGEYFLTGLAEVGPSEWLDATFLEQAARVASRFTIGPGEAKVQNLQIR